MNKIISLQIRDNNLDIKSQPLCWIGTEVPIGIWGYSDGNRTGQNKSWNQTVVFRAGEMS